MRLHRRQVRQIDEISQNEMTEIKTRIIEIINIALGMSGNLDFLTSSEKPKSVENEVYGIVKDAEQTKGKPFADKLTLLARYTLTTRYDIKQEGVTAAIEALNSYYRSNA